MILLLPYNVYILPIELRKYIYSYMITPSARCIIDCKNKHVDEFVNINYDIICAHGFIDTQLYFALDKHWLIFIMSIDSQYQKTNININNPYQSIISIIVQIYMDYIYYRNVIRPISSNQMAKNPYNFKFWTNKRKKHFLNKMV